MDIAIIKQMAHCSRMIVAIKRMHGHPSCTNVCDQLGDLMARDEMPARGTLTNFVRKRCLPDKYTRLIYCCRLLISKAINQIYLHVLVATYIKIAGASIDRLVISFSSVFQRNVT